MSFDIFVQRFDGGDSGLFARAIVEEAFSPYADRSDPSHWELTFAGQYGGDLDIDEDDEIDGFSVNRPSGEAIFWDILIDIMRQSGSVLYWPGGGPCVVDTAVIPHIPKEMIEGLGEPILVKSAEDIFAALRNS